MRSVEEIKKLINDLTNDYIELEESLASKRPNPYYYGSLPESRKEEIEKLEQQLEIVEEKIDLLKWVLDEVD